MITFVSFMRPVNFSSVGVEYWSATENSHKGITCTDKGNHILFECVVQGKQRHVRVPLTNIAQVTLEPEPTRTKEKA